MIDRGQADGILIRTLNSQWIVIDAGADSQQAEAMQKVWGVDKLALVVTSHRHSDHYGGMTQILSRFPVDLYVGNLDDGPNRTTDDTIRAVLKKMNIKTQGPVSDTITVDGVRFVILPPDPVDDDCPGEDNNNSVVVRMEFGEFSMLFTGDAERAQREWLMEIDIYGTVSFGRYVGAQGGYRAITVDYLVDDDRGDLQMKGPYFGGVVRF